jgi:hypothetical protein
MQRTLIIDKKGGYITNLPDDVLSDNVTIHADGLWEVKVGNDVFIYVSTGYKGSCEGFNWVNIK